jgi:hypothetical protein
MTTIIMIAPSLAASDLDRVVGTTKYSEQNHNPKEKGFKLKEYSRLKSHESLSESIPKQAITFVLALRPIGAVAWGSPSQLITTDRCSFGHLRSVGSRS